MSQNSRTAPRIDPRWIRHDAHLWIQPNIERFMRPGVDPADVIPALARDRAQKEAARERARAAEDAAFDAAIAHERRVLAAMREELNEIKAELVRRRRLAEAKYSPSQPRIPKRNPGGGQWTRVGGGVGQAPSNIAKPMGNVDVGDPTSELTGLFNIAPVAIGRDDVQLAGDLPDNPNKTLPDDPAPKVPQKKPETREGRMGFVRDAAQWIARNAVRRAPAVDAFLGSLDQVGSIKAITEAIKSVNDPAKTLEELQEPVGSDSQGGYHDHHIVGQHAQNRARFGDSRMSAIAGLTAGKIRCGFRF
jgi:hypothetical protein